MSHTAVIETGPPMPITAEEADVINGAPFLDTAKGDVYDLLVALDRQEYWSDDPRILVKYMLPAWLGKEHGASTEKDQFTAEQRARAWRIFSDSGMLRRIILPADGMVADEAVVVGGTTPTNYYRQREVHLAIDEQGLQVPRLTQWLGERTREGRDGTLEQLLDPNWPQPGCNDISQNPWVRHQAAVADWHDANPWAAAFATETAVGRAVSLKLVPGGEGLLPHRIDLPVTDLRNPHGKLPSKMHYWDDGLRRHVPARQVLDYHFDANGLEIVAMNAAAQEREMGRPRHTTASCTAEWLDRYPPRPNANIVYATSNPHAVRTARVTKQLLREAGRDDINLLVAAAPLVREGAIYVDLGEERRGYRNPELPAEPAIQIALGEIAAHIARDIKQQSKEHSNEQSRITTT
jgi:hypothetical protein